MRHIIGNNSNDHIESDGCHCNPQVIVVENEELCIHFEYVHEREDEVSDFMREG